MTIKKYFSVLLFMVFGLSTGFAQADSLTSNPTGLRYDITERPWAIMFDITRTIYRVPSIQLSVSYRPNFRFGFESEFNYYYRNIQLHGLNEVNDFLYVRMNPKKPSLFLSGIGKVFFGHKKITYAGGRLAYGSTHFDLSRQVCTKAEPTTSGELCRCLQVENRSLSLRKSQFLYTLRLGVNLPVTKRVRLDIFCDFTGFIYSALHYDALKHDCQNSWSNYQDPPKTDGLFQEFTYESNNFFFSSGLKLGYAF